MALETGFFVFCMSFFCVLRVGLHSGLIIKESIMDENIFDIVEIADVEIWKTDNVPKYWTAVYFKSDYEQFPVKLAESLYHSSKNGMVWYVDFKDDIYKYIVLKDNVLRYHMGDKEGKNIVYEKCIELGVKCEQLDWTE